MNAAVCGVPVSTIMHNRGDEEDVVNDFDTVWDKLHLSRIGIQGTRGRNFHILIFEMLISYHLFLNNVHMEEVIEVLNSIALSN